MNNILLIEDDPEITKLLNLHFDGNRYALTSCSIGKEAIEKFFNEEFHLVILDITLPDLDGMEICKKLREKDKNTPILMLTCHSDESDKVLALELGADDYVTKPFGILELLARVKALLRRSEQNNLNGPALNKEILFKNLIIDSDKRKASVKGKRLDLTPKEFELLLLLASHPGKTFSRQELLERVWGYVFSGYEHTITSHINRLRIKIESNLNHPEYILTSWGTGYRFSE
ncbi:MAG TPA: response regulator transcription factor [Chitinophagaceae bacterium]|nr:response regulator transcription factor [Chitinophagaceae bacterium]